MFSGGPIQSGWDDERQLPALPLRRWTDVERELLAVAAAATGNVARRLRVDRRGNRGDRRRARHGADPRGRRARDRALARRSTRQLASGVMDFDLTDEQQLIRETARQ